MFVFLDEQHRQRQRQRQPTARPAAAAATAAITARARRRRAPPRRQAPPPKKQNQTKNCFEIQEPDFLVSQKSNKSHTRRYSIFLNTKNLLKTQITFFFKKNDMFFDC